MSETFEFKTSQCLHKDYYAGDQRNPFVRTFVGDVEEETSTYDVSEFAEGIDSTKATAIYNMHGYWSKKPHDAIRRYIRHFTSPGDLVLDPFCGSGGTAIASLIERRRAIALDLSPSAGYITAQSLRIFQCSDFTSAVGELRRVLEPWVRDRFHYDKNTVIKAVIYSACFRCSKCLKVFSFISAETGDVRQFRGRKKAKERCPFCEEPINTAKDERSGFVPAELHVAKSFTGRAVKKISVLKNEMIGARFPVAPASIPGALSVPLRDNIQPRLSKNLAKAGATVAGELFSGANLETLTHISNAIEELGNVSSDAKELLHFALHSIIYNCTRMYRYRVHTAGGGGFSGTYYIPHLSKSINPWGAFLDKCKAVGKAILEAQSTQISPMENCAVVSVESATEFCETGSVPSNSVDYIFTDPPYGGTYHYGALNFLWETWRNCNLSWRNSEITISEDGKLTFQDWHQRMQSSMRECFRVLKPGHWITLCFHGEVELWESINDVMAEEGFVSSQTDHALFIDTGQKSYNQLTGATSKKRDLVISFRKPSPGDLRITRVYIPENADHKTFMEVGRDVLRDFLTEHPGSTKDRAYDEVISRLVRRGEMESHDFDALLQSVAEDVSESSDFSEQDSTPTDKRRWYLKETADQIDVAEQSLETSAADLLEQFMLAKLEEQPELDGVHYSDLLEQYFVIGQKPRRHPKEWMPEHFFRTEKGSWRPPADETERQQKAAMREAGTLRRMKRFANALIEGVPVREQDCPDGVLTLVEWIRQCRRAGLYEQGRAMYEKGGLDLSKLDDEEQIEVEDDYRICVKRGSEDKPKKATKGRKKK